MAYYKEEDFKKHRYNMSYLSRMYQTINKHYPHIVVLKDLLANRWQVKINSKDYYFVCNYDLGAFLVPIYVRALNEEYVEYMRRRYSRDRSPYYVR